LPAQRPKRLPAARCRSGSKSPSYRRYSTSCRTVLLRGLGGVLRSHSCNAVRTSLTTRRIAACSLVSLAYTLSRTRPVKPSLRYEDFHDRQSYLRLRSCHRLRYHLFRSACNRGPRRKLAHGRRDYARPLRKSNIGLGIRSGRIYSTGGSFVRHPIQVDGSISASGQARINAVAGPRIAHGTGRFSGFRGSGTWNGSGPSGVCSGVWTAIAVKSVPSFGRKHR
jgi:hypothetical protein